MRLNNTERESLRKRVKILIPQMKKSEILNHFFQKEGYHQRTIYNAINRLQNEESIEDKIKTVRPTSWTSTRKNQLKRLTNNRK